MSDVQNKPAIQNDEILDRITKNLVEFNSKINTVDFNSDEMITKLITARDLVLILPFDYTAQTVKEIYNSIDYKIEECREFFKPNAKGVNQPKSLKRFKFDHMNQTVLINANQDLESLKEKYLKEKELSKKLDSETKELKEDVNRFKNENLQFYCFITKNETLLGQFYRLKATITDLELKGKTDSNVDCEISQLEMEKKSN